MTLEQEPHQVCQFSRLPAQGTKIMFEEIMSALEDLDVRTFRMPGVATHTATAMLFWHSLAAAVEQELVQAKDIVVDYSH
jgi:hypothetical protein